ncbi:hypothetical protein E2C01_015160 [Portunus trituberculatus]|uniref:Uncharacterized protein n=1 Tax=Portunus trituberculatus TaxID=210409 RepID=A0A5B7DM29_PORTR|nr:hypothetical protein [Portunus trituberculatus]
MNYLTHLTVGHELYRTAGASTMVSSKNHQNKPGLYKGRVCGHRQRSDTRTVTTLTHTTLWDCCLTVFAALSAVTYQCSQSTSLPQTVFVPNLPHQSLCSESSSRMYKATPQNTYISDINKERQLPS